MRDNFITYEQALALKELGFNEPCLLEEYFEDSQYVSEWAYEEPFKINTELDHLTDKFNADDDEHYEYSVAVPLKQQVFKWFRDEHYLYHMIHHFEHKKGTSEEFLSEISGKLLLGNDDVSKFSNHNTYEEAESACIDKLISLIKEKK
jgi:hypothetical protein